MMPNTQNNNTKRRVGVLRGGRGGEYPLSIETGSYVLRNLQDTHFAEDIFIDREGNWHLNGFERKPERVLSRFDVVFVALHGEEGESGTIQDMLSSHGMPYTGSGRLATALSFNKHASKNVFNRSDIQTPRHAKIKKGEENLFDKVHDIFRSHTPPFVIKPASGGAGKGVYIAKNLSDMIIGITHSFDHASTVLVEEYIVGTHATCGVIQDFRDEELYALPPTELQTQNGIFDYRHRDTSSYQPLTKSMSEEVKRVEEMAKKAHEALDLGHYSRADFVISKSRGVFILEVNALPHLSDESPFVHQLNSVGADGETFLNHVLSLAED